VICIQSVDLRCWEIKYREPWTDPKTGRVTEYCTHNHPPATRRGSEFPVQRAHQLKGERKLAVEKQFNSGVKPRNILSYLKDNFDGDCKDLESHCRK
jgi:hypothetical protein